MHASVKYWRPDGVPIAPSYSHFLALMAVEDIPANTIVVGVEWEHARRYYHPNTPSVLSKRYEKYRGNWMFRYALAYYASTYSPDASGPAEVAVPPAPFRHSGGFMIEPVVRQSAFMAVLDLPHIYCERCGRHIHLSKFGTAGYSSLDDMSGMDVSKLHDFMWTMAHRWEYDRRSGEFRYKFRSAVERYAKRNERITYEHNDAININIEDGIKPDTIEIRYNEVAPVVSLPAIIYAVEVLFEGRSDLLEVDPFSYDYFTTAADVCNECRDVIESLAEFVKSEGDVVWDWRSVRRALGYILDDAVYKIADEIESFADAVVEVEEAGHMYEQDWYAYGYRLLLPTRCPREVTFRELVDAVASVQRFKDGVLEFNVSANMIADVLCKKFKNPFFVE
jgi:hypothetical protein